MAFQIKDKNPQILSPKEDTISSITKLLNKDIQLFNNGFSDMQKEQFYSKLYTLLNAGVDIKAVLELIEESSNKKVIKETILQIKEAIIDGASFHEALEKSNKFSPFEFYSIKIGEETGQLSEILLELTKFYNTKIVQQRKIISAISYPIVVIITAIAAVGFMLKFLVPMFADVYKRFGGELPTITKYVLAVSDIVSNYGIYLIAAIIILLSISYYARKNTIFRKWSSLLLMKIPIIGDLLHLVYLSRFTKSLALMMHANIPLNQAIDLLKKMISFYPIETVLESMNQSLFEGKSLYESLAVHPIFPKDMLAMVKVGEEVNQIDQILDKLSNEYTKEVTHKTEILNSLLEPILIIFLGLVIGVILIAMYLPIFNLSSQIN